MAPIGLNHYLALAVILFCLGMYGALSRSNAVGVLLSVELMLNGVNVMLVAFSQYIQSSQPYAGQVFAIFIMTVAAAEAAVGLAIIIAVYRLRHTIKVDDIDLLRG
ncbi:MAG: NADH-quinone oxidoreductase subunit NuoK [Chloroflexota bacterium]